LLIASVPTSQTTGTSAKNNKNKNARSGIIQFTLKVLKKEDEQRIFNVYQADSWIEAAKKMAQNLRLDEDMVPYWAAYINERRWELELKSFTPPKNNISSNNHNSGNSFSILIISQFY
jgi:hypothetical protein